jgi:hypothetical protein
MFPHMAKFKESPPITKPSIASGNHVCNNNCADLPALAINIHIPIIFNIFVFVLFVIELNTTENSNELKLKNIKNIANTNPTSPILFTTIAFIAALPANILVVQKFINK